MHTQLEPLCPHVPCPRVQTARKNHRGASGPQGTTQSLRRLLDRGAVTIDNVRFIGATLWTDFRLEADVLGEAWAHHEVGQTAPDFTGAIRDRNAPDGLLSAHESARRHGEDRAFIEAELEKADAAGL